MVIFNSELLNYQRVSLEPRIGELNSWDRLSCWMLIVEPRIGAVKDGETNIAETQRIGTG